MKKYIINESGQGLAEYGLIIALVALAVVAVLGLFGDELNNVFQKIIDTLQGS